MRTYKKISRKIFNYMRIILEKVLMLLISIRSLTSKRAYELMLGIISDIEIPMVGALEILQMEIILSIIKIQLYMRRVHVWRTNHLSTGMLITSQQVQGPPTHIWVMASPKTQRTRWASLSHQRILRNTGTDLILVR